MYLYLNKTKIFWMELHLSLIYLDILMWFEEKFDEVEEEHNYQVLNI